MPTRVLVAIVVLLVGILILGYCAWARRGGSEFARSWLGSSVHARSMDERMTILGGPAIAVLCICFAAVVAPVLDVYLVWFAAPLAIVAFGLMVIALIPIIPLPDALYPGWARKLRRRH